MAAQLFSDEVVKFSFTVKDVPKEPVNSKKSPLSHISPARKKDSGKLGIGGASSSKKNIGGIGKASIRSPVKNNNNNNANKNDNDKNRKSKKTLIANPSVDFGSMKSLLNKFKYSSTSNYCIYHLTTCGTLTPLLGWHLRTTNGPFSAASTPIAPTERHIWKAHP